MKNRVIDISDKKQIPTNLQQLQKQQKNNKIEEIYQIRTLKSKIINEEKIVMVLLFKATEIQFIEAIQEQFGNMIKYYKINCTHKNLDSFARKAFNLEIYPTIIIYQSEKQANLQNFAKISITNSTNYLQEFWNIIKNIVKDKTIKIQNDWQFENALSSAFFNQKQSLVLFHNAQEISISFKSFAFIKKFSKKFDFLNYKNPSKDILIKFGVNKLPAIIAVVGQKIYFYSGRFAFNEIELFLEDIVMRNENQPIFKLNEGENWVKYCKKFSEFCFILFIKQVIQLKNIFKKDHVKKQDILENMKTVQNRFGERAINIFWLDPSDYPDFLLKFKVEIELLPAIILYSPIYGKYAQYQGNFDVSSLYNFIINAIEKKQNGENILFQETEYNFEQKQIKIAKKQEL